MDASSPDGVERPHGKVADGTIRPMRVAIIGSRGYPSTYGGYETLVRYLAPYLVERGHHVTVYCRFRDRNRRVWTDDGIVCVNTRGVETKQLSTLSFGATSIADAARQGFDAALVLNIANGFWLPILRAARVPFAVNTDGLEWERAKWSRLGQAVFKNGARWSARFAPALVCDSRELSDVWQQRFGRSSTFIPYGGEVRRGLDDQAVRDLGLEPRGYALVVARLVPENNVELFLDAVEAAGDDAPHAVVVGSANFDNPITGRLERLAESGKVTWLGHVADQELLAALWQHAGVYVHGHSVGGTNPGLLQALGVGAPTLALDTVFNREVLGRDDQLFPADAAELARRMRDLVASDDRRREFTSRGQHVIGTRYQWPSVCAQYEELLSSLAGKRRRSRGRVRPT